MNSAAAASVGAKIGRVAWEWGKAFIIAAIIALLVRTFVFEFARVSGASMQDTLYNNQFLFVTKFDYIFNAPSRGDIVICSYPNRRETFVKRLIGLPGDTISIESGMVYINGSPLNQDYVTRPSHETMTPIPLKANEYFVLGDNRVSSHDSRATDVGMLTRDMINGHVRTILWPFHIIHDGG